MIWNPSLASSLSRRSIVLLQRILKHFLAMVEYGALRHCPAFGIHEISTPFPSGTIVGERSNLSVSPEPVLDLLKFFQVPNL
jgi:hypothetical protein